jgi:peroxiredoxin family protein
MIAHKIFSCSPSDFQQMNDPAQQAMMDRYNGVFSPLEISAEAFTAAYDTPDIGPHIEKDYKGLSYLSWPFAFRYLKQHFPSLYVAFEEKTVGWPVFGEPGAYIVRPYLTDGIKRTPALVFPVMDRKHNSVQQLDGRAISDNIQRASVKCIATFTGLGLRLYAGEDIPKEDEKASSKLPLQQETPKQTARTSKAPAASKSAPEAAGAASTPASDEVGVFDAKEALMAICKANPLGYIDEKASLAAGKNALENIGLSRATEVKDLSQFGNVVASMVTLWAKEQEMKITKTAMAEELDLIRKAEDADGIIAAIRAFVEKKL